MGYVKNYTPCVNIMGVRLALGRGTNVGTSVTDDAFNNILDTELRISIRNHMSMRLYFHGNLEGD